jgi:hypothetical protein
VRGGHPALGVVQVPADPIRTAPITRDNHREARKPENRRDHLSCSSAQVVGQQLPNCGDIQLANTTESHMEVRPD